MNGEGADALEGSIFHFLPSLVANLLLFAKQLAGEAITSPSLASINIGVIATAIFDSLPTWLLIFGRALHEGRKVAEDDSGSRYWLSRLMLTFISCFGGSTVAGILLSDRAGWINRNDFIPMLMLGWYCATYFPFTRTLYKYRFYRSFVVFIALQAKCNVVMAFVDRVVSLNPTACVGAIVVGTIAGSAGSFILSVEKKLRLGPSYRSALSRPPWSFKLAFFVALLYYIIYDPADHFPYPFGVLSKDGARIFIKVVVCLHGVSEVIANRLWNPFYYLERLLYLITGIPEKDVPPADPYLSSTTPEKKERAKID